MKSLRTYVNTIKQYRLLWAVTLLHLVGLVVVAAILPFETKTINSLNIWIKPLKFIVTTLVYLLTLPFYLELPGLSLRRKKWFANIAGITMLIENLAISGQAARGIQSHFNISSPLNGFIFNIMGIAILVNTVMLVLLLIQFLRVKNHPQMPLIIACRYALALMFIAAVGGAMMAINLHHSIGAPDDAPGMSFTNWNRQGGDLRVMHFFGLHAMQIMPIIVLYEGKKIKMRTVHYSGIVIGLLVIFTFVQALNGLPFAVKKAKPSAVLMEYKK